MTVINCDVVTCSYCIKNCCSKKDIDLKNGECPIAKQKKDMEILIQELKRAQQANNNARVMQNMNIICAEVIEKFHK